MRAAIVALLGIGLVAGCTTFPEIDAAIDARGGAAAGPSLVPIEALLAQPRTLRIDETTGERLAARAAALRRKARALRGPVLTRAERRRLEAAVARRAG